METTTIEEGFSQIINSNEKIYSLLENKENKNIEKAILILLL